MPRYIPYEGPVRPYSTSRPGYPDPRSYIDPRPYMPRGRGRYSHHSSNFVDCRERIERRHRYHDLDPRLRFRMTPPDTRLHFKKRTVQSVVVPSGADTTAASPPGYRHLHKERTHRSEQLQEYRLYGDKDSPKKRKKHDFRSLDDVSTSGSSSTDSNHVDGFRPKTHTRRSNYSEMHRSSEPTAVRHSHSHYKRYSSEDATCAYRESKRLSDIYTRHLIRKGNKTGGSSNREHMLNNSDRRLLQTSESSGGTQVRISSNIKKPDISIAGDPRRYPSRDRKRSPMSLPLPGFAEEALHFMRTGTAKMKFQEVTNKPLVPKSPPIVVESPPNPSLSSPNDSSDSEVVALSPSLEERLKSLDEKYNNWSRRYMRIVPIAPDSNVQHRLLNLNATEREPSDIMKQILARPSIFDADEKRLANIEDKYVPKEYIAQEHSGSPSLNDTNEY